jgi:hypothetical protein
MMPREEPLRPTADSSAVAAPAPSPNPAVPVRRAEKFCPMISSGE